MAVVADQYLIELESNIGKVVSREEAALKSLDRTLGRTSAEVARLETDLGLAGAALQKAAAGRNGIVDVAEVRGAQKELARVQGALDKSRTTQAALESHRPKFSGMAEAAKARTLETQAAKAAEREQKESATRAAKAAEQQSKAIAAAGLTAATALAAAAVALYATIAALVAGYLSLAFAAASAARNQRILGDALTGTAAGGKEFSGVVDQLSRQIPLAKDKIRDMARELALAKLGGRDLQATLTAMGIVAAAVGDQGASAIKSIAEQSKAARRFMIGARDIYGEFTSLAGTGLKKADLLGALAAQMKISTREAERALLAGRVSIEQGVLALEAAAKGRFGKTIAAQMLDFDIQLKKAREALDDLFKDVDLAPLLDGMKTFFSILDTSTVTGDALKFVLTTGLRDVVSILSAGGPIAKKFFQGMIIAALRMYIVLKPIYNDIRDAIGLKPGDGLETSAKAAETAMYALAAAAGVAGVAILIALSPLILLVAVVGALGYAIAAALDSILFSPAKAAIYAIGEAWNTLTEIDYAKLGSDAIDGIVTGITGGAARAMAAIRGLGTSMLQAFRQSIDAHSPSRLFHEVGEIGIAGGVEGGVDAGAPGAHRAIEGLGEARPATPSGAASGGRGGTTIGSFNIGTIVMPSGKPVEADVDSMVRATFRRVLEEINESGLVPEPA